MSSHSSLRLKRIVGTTQVERKEGVDIVFAMKEIYVIRDSWARLNRPYRGWIVWGIRVPTACAVGYSHAPLPGLDHWGPWTGVHGRWSQALIFIEVGDRFPGLAPRGLALRRRWAAWNSSD